MGTACVGEAETPRTMRTLDEIAERVRSDKSAFGFAGEALLPFLDFERAKPFLRPEIVADQWTQVALTEQRVRAEMVAYMSFAWGKVEDHRGLSAGRSVDKISAYVWLMGDDKTLAEVEAAGYAQYGAPKLACVCRAYGIPMPQDDEVQCMIRGEPCRFGCDAGCGR